MTSQVTPMAFRSMFVVSDNLRLRRFWPAGASPQTTAVVSADRFAPPSTEPSSHSSNVDLLSCLVL